MFCTPQSLPSACLDASLLSNTGQPGADQIINQIRRGETGAVFSWAFQTVYPTVRARLVRRGIEQSAACELFTDAVLDFIAAAQKNAALDDQNAAGYLWRICRNKHADLHRARSRSLDAVRYSRLFGVSPDPDKPLMAGVLHAQMQRLPKSYREILRLYYFEEMSCAEIAGHLGSTADSVKERKCRAIKKLRYIFL